MTELTHHRQTCAEGDVNCIKNELTDFCLNPHPDTPKNRELEKWCPK